MSQSRQLAAILFTDIVGYTALMEEDEEQAFNLLKRNREIQRPLIERHNGQWLKEIGDGVLASFSTASDAVFCAKEIQETCGNETRLKLRIGIHLGEVVFEGDDVFGSGVNIASRLEPLAPVGGVLVSESVYKNVRNKKNIAFNYLGEELLRGVIDPVRVYQVELQGLESPDVDQKNQSKEHTIKIKSNKVVWLAIAIFLLGLIGYFMFSGNSEPASEITDVDKEKWIAVLPFVDMSVDQDQGYLGDGIAEELINALVKAEDLKVIARTSSFQFKGENVDVREVGISLNVDYVIEGSVRKYEDQLRITVQLIDAIDGSHIWSEDYDRPFDDIFSMQTQIASSVFGEISSALGFNFSESVTNVNSESYLTYLRARQKLSFRGESNLIEAKRLFEQAINLDSSFDLAYSGLGRTLTLLPYFSDKYIGSDIIEKADLLAMRAINLNSNNSEAYVVLGNVAFYEWKWNLAGQMLNKALAIDPSNAEAINILGDYYGIVGNLDKALEMELKALKFDPLRPVNHHDLGMVYAAIGDWKKALEYATSAKDMNLDFWRNNLLLFRCYLELDDFTQAAKIVNDFEENLKPIAYARIAVSKGLRDEALSYMNKLNETEVGNLMLAESFLLLGMNEEATINFVKSYESGSHSLLGPFFEIPPDHTAIRAAVDEVPKVSELFEIIIANLSASNLYRKRAFDLKI